MNLEDIMQQAQAMQEKIGQAQSELEDVEAEGVSGAGMVKLVLRGKGALVSVTLDPSLGGEDVEMIEDLVKAAHADARKRLDAAMEEKMKEATQGLGGMLPGFKMPF